ncbi:thioredoxin-domain-containing protein [Eremomyces bilateralis CBS 781.70]|uniref:Thioredoxin-domain-containing protein n=1 Tax=Eremomyces bilateralis CBS 781.70 TaxID=1392243 RepID=A0A6G1G836_9PEZI|nr:thioredoxin-domain-containing protein [Eremomyces bilateralis CBS 781.70]KAF1814194.1 thioredoxin-domain-containing protein [Eremomyces bilateralis CBS 781.70]
MYSAISTIAIRRTLIAASRTASATSKRPSFLTIQHLSKPLSHPRFFTMSETKQGVHNLAKKSDWDEALAETNRLIVLDCFATWCGPCKVIAPTVVKFSDAYPEARFYKLDVDEVPDVALELGIRAMPTFLLFKNGENIGSVLGANPKALEAAIQKGYGEGATA